MNTENPYRYLFPIGCLNGVLGAFLWIAFRYGWIEFYPVAQHANLMIGGFLFSYALGFLWTAIPRFLQAPEAGVGELSILVSAMAITPVLGLFSNPLFFYASILLALLTTARFGKKRFQLRRTNPPPSFIFIFVGMCLAAISIFLLMLSSFFELPSLLLACAKNFFLKGFLLCLVLGIGSKLIPVLLGWAPIPSQQKDREVPMRIAPFPLFIISILLGGVFFESYNNTRLAGFFYAASLITAGLYSMKLGKVPKTRSALSVFVWISSIAIALSPLSLTADPSYAVHFWHLTFISGFGLLTLFVSLRVVLAHSGQEFLRWEKRPAFYLLGTLVLFASATRISAPLLDSSHLLGHYAYAAIVWICALGIWAFYYLRFTPGLFSKSKNSTC